ncbi:MAG TPA: hypothetical protein VG455_04130 [Acidimicrobiales bacterium]|nr:hypothetical protein [Acidimicrobiales bacterium]
MSGQSGSAETLWRGAAIAVGLSGGFLGLVAVTSPLVAAAVAVPVAVVVSVVRTHNVSHTAHVLEPTHFEGRAVIAAPRASEVAAAPPAGDTAISAA